METKHCSRCDVEQPLDTAHFRQRKRGGKAVGWRWDSWCRSCYSANAKRLQTINPEKKKQRDKEWREKNSERYHAQARLYQSQLSIPRKQRTKEKARRHNQMLKLKALKAYSNGHLGCSCCAENLIEFLTLDHRQNNGKAHRTSLGGKVYGSKFYKWLESQNYPKDLDLRILCMNCNWARQWSPNQMCPHEFARQQLTLVEGNVRLNQAA